MQSNEATPQKNKESYFLKYLQYALLIISSYKGSEPFHIFIKKYFSLNKKHGSKDRKLITALCYNYFRLGLGVSFNLSETERLLLATFLCEKNFSLFPDFQKGEWNASISSPLDDKIKLTKEIFIPEKIFPFPGELSSEMNLYQFNLSFLVQPRLFIRIRTAFKSLVTDKLKDAGLQFEEMGEDCLAFSNNQKVNNIIEIDETAVVQDFNSQKTLDFLKPILKDNKSTVSLWDCCAGSGGKSILAFDLFKNIKLTVSDRRKNILENLKSRFKRATIKNYNLKNIDLEKSDSAKGELFDIIIADVPCTGSGTWQRTPEQLFFFKEPEIEKYVLLQRKIIENGLPSLKEKGYLLYITCSVFKKENEENISFFRKKYQLNLLHSEYLKGYQLQADTLFAALFIKDDQIIVQQA